MTLILEILKALITLGVLLFLMHEILINANVAAAIVVATVLLLDGFFFYKGYDNSIFWEVKTEQDRAAWQQNTGLVYKDYEDD